MMQYWQLISNKFETRNNRERWMICCALLVVVYAIINALFLSPVITRQKAITSEIQADQLQIQSLKLQLNEFSQKNIVDPDTQNKERIAALRSSLLQLEVQLSGLQTTLVTSDKMPALLRSLLKKNGRLKLVELKTLPTKGLIETPTNEVSNAKPISVLPEQNNTNKRIFKTCR